MKYQFFKLVICFALCCSFTIAQNSSNSSKEVPEDIKIKEISVGTSLQQVIKKANQKLFYKVKISQVLPDEDFIVITSPYKEGGVDPDVYLSIVEKYPGKTFNQEGVKGCYSIQYDVCVLSQNELKDNSYVYIGVVCINNCSFTLEVRYEKETKLELGEDILQYFSEKSHAKIFSIQIPSSTALGNPIGHIAFSVEPLTKLSLNQRFDLYVKKAGEDKAAPTTRDYDLKGQPAWFNGKSTSIYKDSKDVFCTNCQYLLLIEAPPNSLMKIQAWSDDEIMKVTLDNKQIDAVDSEGIVYYQLQLENDQFYDLKTIQNSNLVFELEPFSGVVQLFIHPDSAPKELKDYRWQVLEESKTQFILTSNEREKAKASDKVYYIAIKATYSATFSFVASLNLLNDITFLDFGVTESQNLNKKSSNKYILTVINPSNTNITIKVFNEKGKAEVYGLLCKQDSNSICEITLDQIKKIKSGKKIENMLNLTSEQIFGNQDTHRFSYDYSACSDNSVLGGCNYAIGVYCEKACLYHITPYLIGQHVVLKDGEVESFSLKRGNVMYYKFALGNLDDTIQSIKFNLNTLSGYTRLFVSRSNMYPNDEDSEYNTLFESDSVYYTAKDLQDEITGPYYLTVTSDSSDSYFTLGAIVNRLVKNKTTNKTKLTSKYVHLYKDTPITQSLQQIHEQTFIYFDVDLPENFKGSIDITIAPIQGQFDVYVSNKIKKPTSDKAIWSTVGDFDTTISIPHSDKNFTNKGRYYVTVEVEDSFINSVQKYLFGEEASNQDVSGGFSYTITFTVKSTNEEELTIINEVYEGIPIDGKFQPKSTETYYVKLTKDIQKLTLILYTLSDFAELVSYVSKTAKGQYQNSKQENHYLSAIIEYNQTEIQKICSEQKTTDECKLYVDLKNIQEYKVDFTFSIQIEKENGRLTLRDGKPLFVALPQKNTSTHILFTPNTILNGISITATSYSGDIQVLAKQYDKEQLGSSKEDQDQIVFKFPESDKDSDFTSTHQQFTTSQSIYIQPEDLTCGLNCILAITIQQSENNIIQPSDNEYVTLIASTQLQELKDGQTVQGYVQQSGYKYYSFNVNQKETYIQIQLTSLLESDPELYITYGKNTRPTQDNFTWVLFKTRGDLLQISKSDFPEKSIMEGTYIIGVYGRTASTYTLTVTFTQISIIDVQSGFPFELNLESNQTMYFSYYHYINQSFTINFVKDFGSFRIYVNKVLDENNIVKQLPSNKSYRWSNQYLGTAFTKDFIRINKESKRYCIKCAYLIAIVANQSSSVKATLTIKVDTEFIYLQPGKPFHDVVVNSSYTYYTYYSLENRDAVLKIKVHFGNPIFYVSSSFSYDETNPQKADYVLALTNSSDEHLKDFIQLDLPFSVINNKYCQNDTISCSLFSYVILATTNDQDVHYTITIGPLNNSIPLKEGLSHTDILEPGKNQKFEIFSSEEIFNHEKFNILIHSFDYDHQEKLFNFSILPVVDLKFQKQMDDSNNTVIRAATVLANITNSPEHYIHYQIQYEKGKYLFDLQNPYEIPIKYSVVFQSKEITTISSDEKVYSLIHEEEQLVYEISVESPGLLVIRVAECFGTVHLKLANSIENISQAFNQTKYVPYLNIVDHIEDESHEVFVIHVTTATLVYVGIIVEEGIITSPEYQEVTKSAYFKLTTKLVPESQIDDFKLWKLGHKGQVIHSQNKNYQVNLTWLAPFYVKKKHYDMFSDSSIEYFYTVYFAKDQNYLQMVSRCGDVVLGAGKNPLSQVDRSYFYKEVHCNQAFCMYTQEFQDQDIYNIFLGDEQTLEDMLDTQLFVTVRVDYKQQGEKYFNSDVYQLNEISILFLRRVRSWSFLIYLVVFILLVIIAVFSCKYKAIKEKLTFEMQDIRNIARIGTSRPAGYTNQVVDYEY